MWGWVPDWIFMFLCACCRIPLIYIKIMLHLLHSGLSVLNTVKQVTPAFYYYVMWLRGPEQSWDYLIEVFDSNTPSFATAVVTPTVAIILDRLPHKGRHCRWGHDWVRVFESLCLCSGDGCLYDLNNFITRLQGIILCKDVANVLHAGLHTLCYEPKQPVKTKKW